MKEKNQNPEKNQDQDFILQHQRKRRKRKIQLALESIITIITAVILLFTYAMLTKNEYNKYTEKAKVYYKVNLKENEFYPTDYVEDKNSVVASLIKNIEAEFKYNLDLEKEQEYTYDYKIMAKINVKEGSRANSIYEDEEEILRSEVRESSSKNLRIAEKIDIDYNEYNQKISKFISIYKLDKTTSTLELNMYVNVISKYDGQRINENNKVMTLNIPLTTKTVDISISSNVVEGNGEILLKESQYENLTYMLIIGVALVLVGLVIFVRLIKYMLDTRRAETMYDQELKRIVFNYKSYIQKVNNEVDSKDYKIIEINTFNEILGMRDTIQSPILMYTEENVRRTKFMIINDGMLYVYVLGAQEIREDLRAKHAEKQAKEAAKNK